MKSFIPTYYPTHGYKFFNTYNGLKKITNRVLYDATNIVLNDNTTKHFNSYITFEKILDGSNSYFEYNFPYYIYNIETNLNSSEPLAYETVYNEEYGVEIVSSTNDISTILPSTMGKFLVTELNKEDELDENSTPMIYLYLGGRIESEVGFSGDGYYEEYDIECTPEIFPTNTNIKVNWDLSERVMYTEYSYESQTITAMCSWNDQIFTSSNSKGSCTFNPPSNVKNMTEMPLVWIDCYIKGNYTGGGGGSNPQGDDPYSPEPEDYDAKMKPMNPVVMYAKVYGAYIYEYPDGPHYSSYGSRESFTVIGSYGKYYRTYDGWVLKERTSSSRPD